MSTKDYKIVVSGDVCINSLFWETYHKSNSGFNYENYPNVQIDSKPGQALLLSKLVELSTGSTVLSPKIQKDEYNIEKEILYSNAKLDLFPVTSDDKDNNKVYRVKEFLGFRVSTGNSPKLLPIINDDENADIVILDDENNGFNLNEEFWPLALRKTEKSPIIIYKTNNIDYTNNLWKHIDEFHRKNTIVVINADDLRAKGVNISKGLSWERTALDFVWQINNNPNIDFLSKCHHLIIPFGVEGAIYYRNEKSVESRLFFLTYASEGDFIKETQGKMYGLTSAFVAGITNSIISGLNNKEELHKSIIEGISEGIVAAQKYFVYGFGEKVENNVFPNPNIFREEKNDFIYKEYIQDVLIRNTKNPNCRGCWYIIKDKSTNNLAEIAYNIVKNGEKSALKFIPISQFGNLKTVDRTEIEAYRSIKKLMLEYISSKNVPRPLSIAVFGTPGSGKSFGVTEVASSIAPNLITKLNFNLSQFQSISDLIAAFHKVRDLSLEGKMPLVFFDEFDSNFDGKLGWLKYFLAPMQDGVFREGDSIHPIGKAIFVFAGGTSSTFKEFLGEDITDPNEHKEFLRKFQDAKGPDFVSRLRGYVNILGPNQTNGDWDQLFVVRRAMLLRSLLERKVPHLINKEGEAQIDNGVLRALLKVPRYKHESRSMEAILEMSMLTDAKRWEQSHLPSKDQLKLHVDEEEFLRQLMNNEFYSEKIESIARDLFNNHIILNESIANLNLSCRKSWNEIDEEFKNSLRDQVKHIPNALHKINYDIISVKKKPKIIEFTERELEVLAEYEHKRWSLEKKEHDWKYGNIIDEDKKTHPLLVSWDKLSDEHKKNLIENVKSWPEILANSNFKIERLKFLCYCESLGLV